MKFFVLVIFISDIIAHRSKYCEICLNHTLCKYELPGSSEQCIGYDRDALLTEDDQEDIVDKMNKRRNFIAIGRSKFLPTAANMKKIVWSDELATCAQRWADQCDRSLIPDRTDQCRDLSHLEVGQNIASISGFLPFSSRYNVKSFIELWFMQSMDYTGNVAYYNQAACGSVNHLITNPSSKFKDGYQSSPISFMDINQPSLKPASMKSQDEKTNYFTQLIWADTFQVGCGKAKFYLKNVKPVVVERLVCNFAPKGNVQGKPVYVIGYSATQCPDGMNRDRNYPGLCSRVMELRNDLIKRDESLSTKPPPTSLLKILNLGINDSARQDIDPIYTKLKQTIKNEKFKGRNHSNKETSIKVFNDINSPYNSVKRNYHLINDDFWRSRILNNSNFYGANIKKREKSHSKVRHGHDQSNEFDSLHPDANNHDPQYIYDYITIPHNLEMDQNHRKQNINRHCTRKSKFKPNNYGTTKYINHKINKCTRTAKNSCCRSTVHTNPYEFCDCNTPSNIYRLSTNRCPQSSNCDCVSIKCPTKTCPYILRTQRDADKKLENQSNFQYYDRFPNINQNHISNTTLKTSDARKHINRNYSDRKRRMAEKENNYKPFWQMDEYINKNQPQLKSMKYTTLPKSLLYKETKKRSRVPIKTESITIPYKNVKQFTEKYLSFDELMYLRKHNGNNFNGRRYNNEKNILRESNTATTTPKPSENAATQSSTITETKEYTFNTPYIRLKHCTRKLTCTWTAASLTDSAGSVIPGGAGGAVGGSRTPPGYVEGCTRTSTCTRDYMNRNKMATLPVETSSAEPIPGDDEDYCERRSLNRRSNIDKDQENQNNKSFSQRISKQNTTSHNELLINTSHNCICYYKNFRNKRDNKQINLSIHKNIKRDHKNHISYQDNLLSYGDLYYYVSKKIVEMWGTANSSYTLSCRECICNGVTKIIYSNLLIISIFIQYIFF